MILKITLLRFRRVTGSLSLTRFWSTTLSPAFGHALRGADGLQWRLQIVITLDR